MIKFKPLSNRNENWIYQPDFYLHGKLSDKYDTDAVVMQDDMFGLEYLDITEKV